MPVIALSCEEKPLSPASRDIIRAHCENVHFAMPDPGAMLPVRRFARDEIGTPERLWPALSVLECFRWAEFDRVICLDSDLLVRGSLDVLLHTSESFTAVRATHSETNRPVDFVNTGVMVLTRRFLRGFDFAGLPEMLAGRKPRPGTGKADQAIVNLILHNATMGYLPQRFNYTKRALYHDLADADPSPYEIAAHLDANDIRILHYVGEKPWNPKVRAAELTYSAADALWLDAFDSIAQPSLLRAMDRQRRAWQDRYTGSVRRVRQGKPLSDKAFERRVALEMGL